MKEEQVIKFIEKLDYSYGYKTVNERQNIITELCLIAEIEQLTIPYVVGQSEQLVCDKNELDCPYDFTSRCTMGRCDCKPKAN